MTRWQTTSRGGEHVLVADGEAVGWSRAAEALQREACAREALARSIAAAPHPALFWECCPVDRAGRDAPLRYVLLDSPMLARVGPQQGAFAGELAGAAPVRTFPNLGGDAEIVVPRGLVGADVYTHLAAFLRGAPPAQVHALWTAVGEAVTRWFDRTGAPLWLSTSGLGVHWLHVRLDRRPKYFQHGPYRRWPPPSVGS